MDENSIIEAYNVLAQQVQEDAAARAEQVGNAQRSLGTLAERVATPTGQTSGLANYTYNRLMRPTVDTTAAALVTQGKAQSLEKMLGDQLRAAKNAYEDARNRYQVASSAASGQLAAQYNQQEVTDDNTITTRLKDESTGDASAPATTATQGAINRAALIDTANAIPAIYGQGQLPSSTVGTKFAFVLNGSTHVGYVYPGEGGEVDGVSFTKDGLRNQLDNLVRQGATILDFQGNPTNYSAWKLANKLY